MEHMVISTSNTASDQMFSFPVSIYLHPIFLGIMSSSLLLKTVGNIDLCTQQMCHVVTGQPLCKINVPIHLLLDHLFNGETIMT